MSYVQLIGLRKNFADRVALKDLHLSIDKGELVSLLGPSGCGKTTTLRIIAGFEKPDTGEVQIGGDSILQVPPSQRNIGVVFQQYALFPHLTAKDNIAFGMRMAHLQQNEIARRVDELLDLIDLRESKNAYPHQLSGGQQQRIALARALAIRPRLLLLDEPLSALDAVVRISLRDEIRRIQKTTGMTTIYVTHDQEEALAISDRVVVMQQGVIEQIGSAELIYSQPASHFVAGFIGKMNQVQGVVADPKAGLLQCGNLLVAVPEEQTRNLPEGKSVTALIRPEAITLASGEVAKWDPGINQVQGRLSGTAFLGSIRRVTVLADEHRFVADISATARIPALLDEVVTCSFPRESCRILVDGPSTGLTRQPSRS